MLTYADVLTDNAARLQQLRQQLRQADADAALWARVDELLGKYADVC